jgi:hypothetical protein
VEIGKKSYATEVVDLADERVDHSKSGGGGFLEPQMFYLPTPEVLCLSVVLSSIIFSVLFNQRVNNF